MYAIRSYYARLYTDLGLLTGDNNIGQDLTELFNFLTGYSPPPSYRKILAAPYTLKKTLLENVITSYSIHYTKLYESRPSEAPATANSQRARVYRPSSSAQTTGITRKIRRMVMTLGMRNNFV